jgi:molybdopterin-binding protein
MGLALIIKHMRFGHTPMPSHRFSSGVGLLKVVASSTTCSTGALTMTITAINVRNQFRGKVKEIVDGPVVSEIDVETPSGLIVTSVITTRSVKELGLVVGKEVIALVKSTEVAIAAL